MKDLWMKGIFYDVEGGGASPSAEGEPSATPAPTGTQGGPRGAKPQNVGSFLKKAPVMGIPKTVEHEVEGGFPAPQKANVGPKAVEGEGNTAKPEPLIKGPGGKQQPGEGAEPGEVAKGDTPKGEASGVTIKHGDSVKIGDLEHTAEEWEAFAKDYANDHTWKANNAKRSQIIAKFSDEMLSDLAPYALSQRELPNDFKKKLSEAAEVPTTFKVKDADGYDIDVSVDDIPKEYHEAVKAQILSEVFPEFMTVSEENKTLKEQASKMQEQVSEQDITEGTRSSVEFMKEYPDFAITLYPGEKLETVLADIFKSGDVHPEYENAKRFAAVLNSVGVGVFRDFGEAAQSLFGSSKRKQETIDQVTKNQEEGLPEQPGGRNVNDHGAGILDKMAKRGKGAKYANLGRA